MAKNDSKHSGQAAQRVYKANSVHKRRAGRKAPASEPVRGVESAAPAAVPDEPEPAEVAAPEPAEAATTEPAEPAVPASGKPVPAESEPVSSAESEPVQPAAGQLKSDSADTPAGEEEDSPAVSSGGGLDEATSEVFGEESPDVVGDEADGATPDDGLADSGGMRHRKKMRPRTVVLVVLAVLVVAAVAAASLFAWNRWGRYDDAADFQGQWYVQGTAVSVSIDESLIHLDQSVAYSYAIDAQDKTISYTFGDWEGQGRYWFSDDRSKLVITDGSDFTGAGNTADDLERLLEDLKPGAGSSEADQEQEDGSIALSRTAPTVALVMQQVKDRAAEEEAAAQEALDEESYDYYY